MTGMANVARPSKMISSPAPRRLRLMNADSFDALRPVAIIAGMVPSPKASMTRLPVIAFAVVAASSSTL